MKVAVVGGGFSGLAVSYYLLSLGVKVDLYDEKGVGGGASGVSCGLLHPYLGEQVRRASKALESLEEVKYLLQVAQAFSKVPVADFSGILRVATPRQAEIFLEHIASYGDVEKLSETLFFLKTGVTVYSREYLQGLYKACEEKGLQFILRKVGSFEELKEYDHFVLAIGSGVFSFPGLDCSKLSGIKGQALLCKWPFKKLQRPLLGKGHIVSIPGTSLVHLGATYERGLLDGQACPSTACLDLKPKARVLVPEWKEIEVQECRAGVRVMQIGKTTPYICQIGKGWVFTGLGSRGLLYHGYFAKKLARVLVLKEEMGESH